MTYIELLIYLSFISLLSLIILSFQFLYDKINNIKFISEIAEIKENISIFKRIYSFYPGDYPHAKKILRSNYQGNGDDFIRDNSESLYVFDHVIKAGIITKYNLNHQVHSYAKKNSNVIASKYSNCGYQLISDSKLNNKNIIFDKIYVFLRIADEKNKGNLTKPCSTVLLSKYIDHKLDDGNPITGNFLSDDRYNSKKEENGKCICKDKENIVSYCNFNYNENCIMQFKFF
jgi:hypothetical protein